MAQRLNPTTLRRLATELSKLQSNPPEGILVHINEEQITEIHATIHGPQDTPYASGQFQVRLLISDDFPNTPPTGTFVTKIFHPNVSERGEICVNTLKRDWQKHYGIEHVLVTIKCLLIYPNPESALNAEAGKLLLEQYEDYASRARLMTEVHAKPRNCAESMRVDAENQDPQAKPKDKSRKKNLKRF
ncbi:ubiquitin-conjugating enzyme E2 S [Coemansia sp. RSA 1822]|nr:ubiquitin-conjugating enzyme E2 S [Coemansia sp. RSA 638]KAJ2544197.1 ubiquitin-conjugating enzyme E2 S [Coemansia sp. RSA 1853]KAJ2565792.1 ubiquitin-conjugating enzyme E2 S [Coemansia sp. RSA 1822]